MLLLTFNYNSVIVIFIISFAPFVLNVRTGILADNASTKVIPNDSILDKFTYKSEFKYFNIIFLLEKKIFIINKKIFEYFKIFSYLYIVLLFNNL